MPSSALDRLSYPGTTVEVWLPPGITPEDLPATQALAYRQKRTEGRISLVLGAGNVSSIPASDILDRLFRCDEVVLCKLSPLNDYLAPLLRRAFRTLIENGFLRIVTGGAAEGDYLCHHPQVGSIHLTGSETTFDAILYGAGDSGRSRKARRRPRLQKPITAELGDVAPVIVVPGPWSKRDLSYQAWHLASMLTSNAGCNCSTPRVIVQHAGWPQRRELLDHLQRVLARVPTRTAFYPGATSRWQSLVEAHPEAKKIGAYQEGRLPWTFASDLDPDVNDPCFSSEALCSFCCETAIEASGVADYLDEAVNFANERLRGSLSATLLVHPVSLRDPEVHRAVERALDELHYGTVCLNYWPGIGWGQVTPPWGAFAAGEGSELGSGRGFAHNTLMFSQVEKTVVRAPFRAFPPPPWFPSFKRYEQLSDRLMHFEAAPSATKIPALLATFLLGWL
jgi:hypothetical protein